MTIDDEYLDFMKRLHAVQSAMPVIPKETEGYGYKYAALDDIMELLSPLLVKHGLFLTHSTTIVDEKLHLVTSIHDTVSNSFKTACLPLYSAGSKNPMQELGAAVTYARRYTISMLFAICTDEDTDGVLKAKVQEAKLKNGVRISNAQAAQLKERLGDLEPEYMKLWAKYGWATVHELPQEKFACVCDHLENWLAKRASNGSQ